MGAVASAQDRAGRLARGELALREGRIDHALLEARALLRLAPQDTDALSLRVRALRRAPQLGDLQDAEADLYEADPATAVRLAIARPGRRDRRRLRATATASTAE